MSAGAGRHHRSATVAGLSGSRRATEVVIRAARLEDVKRVLALWDQARSPAAVTPDDVRSVSRLIAHTDDALLVAVLDGQIVGALIAAWDGWRGNMTASPCSPTFVGRASRHAWSRRGTSTYEAKLRLG